MVATGGLSGPPNPPPRPVLAWAASRHRGGQDEALLQQPHAEVWCGRQGTAGRGTAAAPHEEPACPWLPAGPGWTGAAAEPLPQPSASGSPGSAAARWGWGESWGGGTTGWADIGAGGSNTEGRLHRGCSPPAPLGRPDTSPWAASVQASVRAGWRCRWHVPGTPRQWRLAVVAQVAVPCPVP